MNILKVRISAARGRWGITIKMIKKQNVKKIIHLYFHSYPLPPLRHNFNLENDFNTTNTTERKHF